ncbi:hypothetical protein LXL04_002826 [Taraxacum kok-saghyz]
MHIKVNKLNEWFRFLQCTYPSPSRDPAPSSDPAPDCLLLYQVPATSTAPTQLPIFTPTYKPFVSSSSLPSSSDPSQRTATPFAFHRTSTIPTAPSPTREPAPSSDPAPDFHTDLQPLRPVFLVNSDSISIPSNFCNLDPSISGVQNQYLRVCGSPFQRVAISNRFRDEAFQKDGGAPASKFCIPQMVANTFGFGQAHDSTVDIQLDTVNATLWCNGVKA